MTESEKMDLILLELKEMRTDVSELKEDVSGLKADVSELKADVSGLKTDVSVLKKDVFRLERDVSGLKQEMSGIKLHLENVTDKNISILAENHVDLVRKLNEAIPTADNNAAYAVQVNYLTERVTKLEKEFSDFKSKSA